MLFKVTVLADIKMHISISDEYNSFLLSQKKKKKKKTNTKTSVMYNQEVLKETKAEAVSGPCYISNGASYENFKGFRPLTLFTKCSI